MKILKCSSGDYGVLSRSITDFNLSHLPQGSEINELFGFILKDSFWGIRGGIVGRLMLGNCLNIEILWIEEKYRCQGFGTQLLKQMEDTARAKGSHLAQVDTFDFQALDFYLKNGYEQFGILEDSPTIGHKRFYLKKRLEKS